MEKKDETTVVWGGAAGREVLEQYLPVTEWFVFTNGPSALAFGGHLPTGQEVDSYRCQVPLEIGQTNCSGAPREQLRKCYNDEL